MPPPLLAPPPDARGVARGDPSGAATSPAAAPQPRELNTRTSGAFLCVGKDKLSARYDGAGAHGNDVGAAQADAAVPDDVAVYYFELSVVSPGARGCIGIGFSDKSFKTSRQPGCAAGLRVRCRAGVAAGGWRSAAGQHAAHTPSCCHARVVPWARAGHACVRAAHCATCLRTPRAPVA
jgi:hypothetical protein